MYRGFILVILFLISYNPLPAGNNFYDSSPPKKSEVVLGYNIDAVKDYLDNTDIDAIEGIWEFPDDMITLSIKRFSDKSFSERYKYQVILLDSEDRSLSQIGRASCR